MKRILPLLSFAAAALPAAPALAHPHVFIDVRMDMKFDETGAITEMQQTWLFDEMYSTMLAEDLDVDRDGTPDQGEMDSFLVDVMRGLKDFHFYTDVKQDDVDVAVEITGDMFARFDGVNMEIAFTLKPAVPLEPGEKTVAWAVYDPTYYIDMLPAEDDAAILLSGAPEGCSSMRIKPDPDPSTVELAASLDQTMSAGDTLGAFFAEWVFVDCEQPS